MLLFHDGEKVDRVQVESATVVWILLGLFQGVESSLIEDHVRRFPNQGIRRSLRNSIYLALISSGIIGVRKCI